MKQPEEPIKLPSRAEWDFGLGGCPSEELAHCYAYEYAMDCPSAVETVQWWRQENRQVMRLENEKFGKALLDRWYGSPFRVFCEYADFPKKHWLDIDAQTRQRKIKVDKLPPFSCIRFPNSQQFKYRGPQPADMTRLEGERNVWQEIIRETGDLIRECLQATSSTRTLRSLPKKLSRYLSPEECAEWRRKLSKLSGDELGLAASKLRVVCENKIGKRRRQPRETIVYEVDWTLRPDELVDQFQKWVNINRVRDPRDRTGGHPAKPDELLKALGAKRLLEFFRMQQSRLPAPYKNLTLHAALSDFTTDQRRAAGRPAKPLYKTIKGWNGAALVATEQLQKLCRLA
jgi:hypothetical protein